MCYSSRGQSVLLLSHLAHLAWGVGGGGKSASLDINLAGSSKPTQTDTQTPSLPPSFEDVAELPSLRGVAVAIKDQRIPLS